MVDFPVRDAAPAIRDAQCHNVTRLVPQIHRENTTLPDIIRTASSSDLQAMEVPLQTFRRDGDYWTVEYQGAVLHLRDSKGLRYLARLMHRPKERFSALELLAEESGRPASVVEAGPAEAERARSAVTKRIRSAIAHIRAHHDGLGRHLLASVHTGQRCVYDPDPALPARWVD